MYNPDEGGISEASAWGIRILLTEKGSARIIIFIPENY
jgi:hypothetical protein